MGSFTDSAPYKRFQSIIDMPDDGTPEMAKAKRVAQERLGQLATSHMAKQAGIEDPFKMERVKDPETGKIKMSPALLPEELRNIKGAARPIPSGGAGSVGSGTVDLERGMRGASTKPKAMKKGGKVAGKLAKRGYGIAR